MARFSPFRRFDPRLASDLNGQRRAIALGLACVLVTSVLDGLTIPLIERSFTAIQEAAPRAVSARAFEEKRREELRARARSIAISLGQEEERVLDVLAQGDRAGRDVSERTLAARIAGTLNVPARRAEAAVAATGNRPTGNVDAVNRLAWSALGVVLVFALKYWFTRGQSYYLSKASATLAADLRNRLFAKLQRLPVSYFSGRRSGALQSVLTNDVGMYQSAVGIVRDSIDAPIRASIAFFFVLYYQWQLAAVTALFLPLMAAVIRRNGRRMKDAQARAQDDLADLSAETTEALAGQRVVKAFAAEDRMAERYRAINARSLASQLAAARRQASLRPLVELIGAVALAAVIYLCGWLSYRGWLQLGQIAALVFALDRINQGFRSLGGVANTYNQVQAASDRIYTEILEQPEVHEVGGGRTLPAVRGRIEFEGVTFRYPDGTEALSDVSFVLEPGTSLALVGPSGAGKSTIADLVLRFYDPTEGAIRLDGVDLRELDPRWLRERLGVVPQHTFLFAGTLAENLRMGRPEATDADLARAARLAHLTEVLDALPDGVEARIGEGGSGLSGGQRQRVAIARALVRDPDVLLLDEATSALDAESERAVTAALADVMRETTTLFIAHRLTTAARADRILVLSRGRVVEEGTHESLLAAGGAYAGLFRAFSGGVLG